MATKREIMLSCLTQLSMVYGTNTNRYAEERLYSLIDDALQTVFKERFWDRFMKKVKVDVNNGYPILNNLEKVCRDFDDIQTVMNNQHYPRELSRGNLSIIKSVYTGTVPAFYQRADKADKLFQVVPSASGISLWVIFRTLCKPDVFDKFLAGESQIDPANNRFKYTAEDEIPFDDLAIKYYVCHQYMVVKGDNREAEQMFARLYTERMDKLRASELNSTMSFEVGPQQTYAHGWWAE